MAPSSELDASIWFFIITLAVLSILMVLTLVLFTAALVAHPRQKKANPLSIDELRAALLALNTPEREYRLVRLSDTEMRLDWNVVDASWYELFAKVKLTTVYRARLLLYEPDHEVRCHETLRSTNFFIGLDGPNLHINWGLTYQSGALNVIWSGLAYGIKKGWPPRIGEVYRFSLDTIKAKREIEETARKMGWYFRPVALRFETTARGVALAERLTPPFMRSWSRKQFWGILYGASWVGIVALFLFTMPWTANNILVVASFPVIFVVFQALFVWLWRAMERYSVRKAK